jgi:diphthamide biosynthesis enzyme Dph1/Dph2-like protein
MKKIFIPAYSNIEIPDSIIDIAIKQLPENISICYSIQFKKIAEKIKNRINKKLNVLAFEQVLGCSSPLFPKETQAILLISNGKFHAVSLAFESKIPVFLIDNFNFKKISNEEITKKKQKEKAAYLNYLNSKEAGIILTIKPGQQRLEQAIKLKNVSEKKHYLFLCNNVNPFEFENFGLKSWVNTACPRMDFDDPRIINLSKLNISNRKNCF